MKWIVRPRLVRLLDEARQAKQSVLIEAPAGYGKTTLVQQWVGRKKRPGVDIIDDAHEQEDLAALQKAAASGKAVILSRRKLALRTARLEVSGSLIRITPAMLAFTEAELDEHVGASAGVRLLPPESRAVVEQTWGWPVAIDLFARAIGQDGSVASALAGMSERLSAYVREELVELLPGELRRLAFVVSVHPFFETEAVEPLWESDDGTALLEQLRDVWLLVHAEAEHHRLLPPLHSYLQDHLFRELGKPARALYRRACLWSAARERRTLAIEQAFVAQDEPLAIEMLETFALDAIWETGHAQQIIDLISRLDVALRFAHPRIALAEGWARFTLGDVGELSAWLDRIEAALETHEDAPQELPGLVMALRGWASVGRDDEHALGLFRRALEALPEDEVYLLAYAYQGLGYVHRLSGNTEPALEFLAKSKAAASHSPTHGANVFARYDLSQVHHIRCELTEGIAELDEALALMGESPAPNYAQLFVARAALRLDGGDLEGCSSDLTQAHLLAGADGFFGTDTLIYCKAAELSLGQGAVEQAADFLDRARATADPGYSAWVSNRIDILDMDSRRIAHVTTPIDGQAIDLPVHEQHLRDVAEARWLGVSQPDDAVAALRTLAKTAAAHAWIRSHIDIQLALAELTGEHSHCMLALELAARPGCVWPFIRESRWVSGVLGDLDLPEEIDRFADELTTLFARRVEVPLVFDALSDREMEILRLLERGLSNREIGARLYIATGTVSAHTHKIYRKLSVRNRTEALARAHAVGLL